MNKLIYILISILATLFAFKIYAAERTVQYRDMELAGIVVDSQSLSPLGKVTILDNNNKNRRDRYQWILQSKICCK